jgi:hypothetical protein
MRRLVLLTLMFALVLASCGGSSSSGETTTDTGLPENPDRCEEAPRVVRDHLASGFVSTDMTMPWGFGVKSTDYDDVWIVAGAVQGPDDIDYGTWAIRANTWPDTYLGTVSIDVIAMTVSNWGEGTDIIVTQFTDGVKSAGACATAMLVG